jgi:hypothetical protein
LQELVFDLKQIIRSVTLIEGYSFLVKQLLFFDVSENNPSKDKQKNGLGMLSDSSDNILQ